MVMPQGNPLTTEDARARLCAAFQSMESWDLRVGYIWLNPKDTRTIKPLIDPVSSLRTHRLISGKFGAVFAGHCFGALVFASDLIPVGHIALAPDGMEAKITSSSAARAL